MIPPVFPTMRDHESWRDFRNTERFWNLNDSQRAYVAIEAMQEAFPDSCKRCADIKVYGPSGLIRWEDITAYLAYKCSNGHYWTTGYRNDLRLLRFT